MNDLHAQFVTVFKNQHRFSKDYSPLYASLFAAVAGWLDEGQHNQVVSWLLDASDGRRPFDVAILLAAGLHRDVLLEKPQLSALAEYYPSVAGTLTAGKPLENGWQISQDYEQALYRSIVARGDHLREFIQSNQVQTNETGRGISWLLPISLAGWPRVHLLDLGASAGLNLVADRRNYQFMDSQNGRVSFRLGEANPIQFEVRSSAGFDCLDSADGITPMILSRHGCDINPFMLRTPFDEATLAAFVWADQTVRLERLREGIAAYRQVNKSHAPVKLHAFELPQGLSSLLAGHVSDDSEAVICYNTYIRMYLPDKGFALRRYLARWAKKQIRPVVWIQWEPPSCLNGRHGTPPKYGWLAWTIDMWHGGEEHHWHVAWVHPHGHQVHWLPELQDWIKKARSLR